MNESPETLKFSPSMAAIAAKLVLVAKTIQHPDRSQTNKFQKYDYSSRDDIFEVARIALAENGVAWIPSMRRISMSPTGDTTKSGASQMRNHVRVEIVYVDSESGEWVTQAWEGDGISNDDKGIQGAGTQAVRFAITDMFMLLDGLDMDSPRAETATNHTVTREKAPPENPGRELVKRLYALEFSEEQATQFVAFVAKTEGVATAKDIPAARMRLWFDRMEKKTDAEVRETVMGILSQMDAA